MKKRVKSAIALLSALATLSCGALSASAGNLTKEQLIEKYGYRCNITDQVTIGSNEKWAAFEIKDAGANISETIASGVENGFAALRKNFCKFKNCDKKRYMGVV